MKIKVKKATFANKDDLRLLINSLEETEIEINKIFFSNNHNICLIAYINQIAVGYLYAYILTDIKDRPKKMFLYSIDVVKNYQRMGVATKLISFLKEEAFVSNCSEIFVLTNNSNEAAMKMYKATGGIRENEDDVMFVYQI